MSRVLNRFVTWLHAGYPNDVPLIDQVPLIALLTKDFSRESTTAIAGGAAE